jgi:hypothetical protein
MLYWKTPEFSIQLYLAQALYYGIFLRKEDYGMARMLHTRRENGEECNVRTYTESIE